MSAADRRHLRRVKALPCALCGQAGPSDAHHLLAGRTPGRKSPHWLTIPLCKDCHQGSRNGIHGQRIMWNVMKKTETMCLNETLETLYGSIR